MTRRPNLEGSVYFDASNSRYICAVPFKDDAGRLKTRKHRRAKQGDAEILRREFVKLRDADDPSIVRATQPETIALKAELVAKRRRKKTGGHTVETWFAFLEAEVWPKGGRQKKGLAAKTLRSYKSNLAVHIVPEFGDTPIDAVEATAVECWVNRIESTSAAAHALTLLNIGLNKAVDYRLIPYNPAAVIEAPYHEERDVIVLTAEQVALLYKTADEQGAHMYERLAGMCRLAITTGARISEIIGVRREDIDLDKALWHVNWQWSEEEQTWALPKGGKRRVAPLSRSMVGWLAAWLDGRTDASPFVFPSWTGDAQRHRNLTEDFHILLELARLPKIRFHWLRHASSSLMHAAGADTKTRSDLLGHAEEVNGETYTEVYVEHLRQAVERADSLVAGTEKKTA